MSGPAAEPHVLVEWGWDGRALEGDSGDLHVVTAFDGGVLVGLVDGLGHGPEAAAAARAAVAVLEENADEPVVLLVQRCHEALRKTRGAVMSLVSFRKQDSSVTWIGVGNVDGILVPANIGDDRRREAIHARGGVVGYQLPPLRAATLLVSRGDTIILTTDGIRSGYSTELASELRPQELAESIVARFASGRDDAHALVARYLGGGP
jgi:negative regulator of sigma-B (phosphoserine phosphatase)